MKVEEKGHTFIIKDTQGNCGAFLMKITHEHKSFKNHNLIVDITHDEKVSSTLLTGFLPLSKEHRKANKSFIIVASDIDFNAVPQALTVVPSILEAHDIIEMEEIERDLGF